MKFELTQDQVKEICGFFNQDEKVLDDWQIAELVDKLIDRAICELNPT